MTKKDAMRAAVEALQAKTESLAWSGRSVDYISGYEAGFEAAKESALSLLRSALEEGEEPVAWLVTGGRAFVDRAFVTKAGAEKSLAERKDGARLVPLYASPTADKEQP